MKRLLSYLILTGVASGLAGASDERWIHVRVDDAEGAEGRVDIQVPISLVSSLLPAIQATSAHGTIHMKGSDVDLAQIRGFWNAVRASKDGEYVTVRDADSDVSVAKRDGYFRVALDDKNGKSRVRMKIPLPLVDAVLTGGDKIDLDALGGALAKAPVGELLTVDDEDSHVRIWIDGKAAPAREDTP